MYYCFEVNGLYIGKSLTTESEIHKNFSRVSIVGNLVKILSV